MEVLKKPATKTAKAIVKNRVPTAVLEGAAAFANLGPKDVVASARLRSAKAIAKVGVHQEAVDLPTSVIQAAAPDLISTQPIPKTKPV